MLSLRNTMSPYENESTFFPYGYNKIKKKNEFTKIHRKKNFINRLKCSEKRRNCVFIYVYRIFEGVDSNELCECLT